MLHHRRLVDVEGARIGAGNSRSAALRQSRQQQQQPRLVRSDEEDEEADDAANFDDLEDQWRQAAQMLTDDDELLLAGASDSRGNGARSGLGQHSQLRQTSASRQQFAGRSPATPTPSAQRRAQLVESEELQEYSDDDNSSISFAQSGCHSILSAWRIKSANRRAARQAPRPVSVLSNGSSNGKKSTIASTAFTSRGKSPASQSRIALGPKQAQHFVTNTRRRRRANELILSTLEARRRALSLNRQNASSIYGSNPYLAFEGGAGGPDGASLGAQQQQQRQPGYEVGAGDYGAGCVSLSPSPVGRKTPSPAPRAARAALSDLGAARSAANATAAAQAQRQRLLRSVNQQQQQYHKSPSPSQQQQLKLKTQAAKKALSRSVGNRQPPLAKLDQNSSDLYSSNSSSSLSDSSSSSSGSQFTQLVTSELVAPGECLLLGDEQALGRAPTPRRSTYQPPPATGRPRPAERTTRPQQASSSGLSAARSRSSPSAAERRRREPQQQQQQLEPTSSRQQQQQLQEATANADERSARMRRGALGRDSIRRLRLNRASSTGQAGQTSNGSSWSGDSAAPSSGVSSSDSSANQQQQAAASSVRQLSAQRKQDIESNPFLNRGHFRSTSVRSVASRAGSVAAPTYEEQQQQQPVAAAKRSSWLFGGTKKQATTSTDSSNPSAAGFSLAETRRRSSSSENIERERTSNKTSKQPDEQEQEQRRNIRQVEQMLRQMRPNQVFTSYAKENTTVKSQSGSSRAPQSQAAGDDKSYSTTTTSRQLTTSARLSSARPTSPPPPPPPPRPRPPQRAPSRQRGLAQAAPGSPERQQVAPPPTSAARSASAARPRPMSPGASSSGWPAKSHDDLRLDAGRNKQGAALEEGWRRAKSPQSPRQQVSDRLARERLETLRSTSISPVAEFADSSARAWRPPPASSSATTPTAAQMLAGQPLTPADRVAALQRGAAQREAQREAMQCQQQQRQAAGGAAEQQASRRQPATAVVDTPPTRRRLLEPAATSQVFLRSSKQRAAAPSSVIGASPSPAQTEALPTFERTADDEFRKRVDYLRKLARSNLSEPATRTSQRQPQAGSSRAAQSHLLAAAERPAQQSTTRPLSTNWRPREGPDSPPPPPAKQLSVETRDRRPPSLLSQQHRPPISPKPRLTTSTTSAKSGSSANSSIEVALLADRYQTRDQLCSGGVPGAAFKWRRSNSSLASLGSSSTAAGSRLAAAACPSRPQSQSSAATSAGSRTVPPRPPSPLSSSELGGRWARPSEPARVAYANLALGGGPAAVATSAARPPSRSSSVLSQPPNRELTSQAVVKLVVKEKSAPKLDYAFVEGREETSSGEENPAAPRVVASSRQREAPPTPARPTSLAAGSLEQLPSKTQVVSRLAQQQQQLATQTRSPIRVASPRSPEFGAMATSSNDDSAIASSVSSPSLSFMLNPAEQQRAAAAAANAAAARSASPMSGGARASSTSRPTATTTNPASAPRALQPTGGNLQSILRRQQQQQYQRQSGESSPDGSQQAPPREQQHRLGSPTESSPTKRPLGLTSSEFGQQSPANLQHQRQQLQQQQQQLSSSESTSDFRSSSFSPAGSLLPSGDESTTQLRSQQQQAASATSSPPKRVHFNDRTSIRSFESVSSLASNSTAVPNEALRQQVGSPDSMGSGSTSRLSADSPDLRKSSGAAIYAIRGDPELELDSSQQILAPSNLASNFQQQQPHLQYQMPREFESQAHRQQQLIRMTAPPTISTSAGAHQSAIQYIARPTSLTSTQIVPTKVTLAGPQHQLYRPQQQLPEDDEDDPNYVLRLRQAATSGRVFNYSALPGQLPPPAAPLAIPAHHNQHQALVAGGMQHLPMGQVPPPPPPPADAVQAHLQQQQQQQRQHQRRPFGGLLNFQTEV